MKKKFTFSIIENLKNKYSCKLATIFLVLFFASSINGFAGMFVYYPGTISAINNGNTFYCFNAPATSLNVTITENYGCAPSSAIKAPRTFKWYSNSSNSTSGGTVVYTDPSTTATSSSYTPPTTTAGTLYYYCVVTWGAFDCIAAGSISNSSAVYVTVSGAVTGHASPSTNICPGTMLTLTGSGATSYTWSGGITNGVAFTPTISTSYTVTATDINNCISTDIISINIFPPVIVKANANPSNNLCPGIMLTLSGSGANSYTWTGGVTNNTAFTPSLSTSYTITGTDVNNCTNSDIISIHIFPPVTVNAHANPSTNICSGTVLTLTGSGATSYTWSGGITNGVAFTPTVSTSYTVVGSDINNCTSSAIISIHVPPAPLAPEICLVTTDSASNYQYNTIHWQNTLYTNADSFIVYRYGSGHYLVLGTVSKDSTRFIDQNRNIGGPNGGDPNIAGWQYTIAIKDTCANISPMSPYHFTSNFQQNNQNLSWSPYQIQSPQTNPLNGYQVLRDSAGIGQFHVFANTSYLTTSTQDPSYASYPNAQYRVDALGFNCISNGRLVSGGNNNTYTVRQKSHSNTANRQSGTTSLNTFASNSYKVSVYPNPSNGTFNLAISQFDNSKTNSIEIYNAIGACIHRQIITSPNCQINIADVSNGVYQLRIVKNNTLIYQTKISKID